MAERSGSEVDACFRLEMERRRQVGRVDGQVGQRFLLMAIGAVVEFS